MKSILICFANDKRESLTYLKEEREAISKVLDDGNSKSHYIVKQIPQATTDIVIDALGVYRESLNVFLYSGHAGCASLDLEDGKANAEGVASLLALCPKLNLVVLNGCSTIGQVSPLLQLPSRPAVIATSSPICDSTASKFSQYLFKALVKDKMSLGKAFDYAIASLKVKYDVSIINTIKTREFRELMSGNANIDEGVWGLFMPENRKELAEWKLLDQNSKVKLEKKALSNKTGSIIVNNSRAHIGKIISINKLDKLTIN